MLSSPIAKVVGPENEGGGPKGKYPVGLWLRESASPKTRPSGAPRLLRDLQLHPLHTQVRRQIP